jgi:surface antigen
MIKKISVALFFSAALVLVGCAGMGPKQTAGTVIGGGLGGLAGSTIGHGSGQVAAAAAGALLGSMLGGFVGQQMDQSDELMARRNAQRVLDMDANGASGSWRNPNTAWSGESTVISTDRTNGNCRMLHSVTFDDFGEEVGRERVLYCRGANGQWAPAN